MAEHTACSMAPTSDPRGYGYSGFGLRETSFPANFNSGQVRQPSFDGVVLLSSVPTRNLDRSCLRKCSERPQSGKGRLSPWMPRNQGRTALAVACIQVIHSHVKFS